LYVKDSAETEESFKITAVCASSCNNNNNNNNSNNVFTDIAPFNIYRMIKGSVQSKKTNIYNR